MTPTRNSPQIAIGIAGAMGCYITILAAASILLGLWIDSLLGNERRIATLICVLAGIPINLFSAVWLTLRLIARAFPQAAPTSKRAEEPPEEPN
ncbi:MAG: hypothetical protein CUN49_06015 [Candidatus Thermofonsia Clade 1 bacterium]|jgi:hypothetical protein|uniref:AtpZ/AtpI family protein n=1 Tax=Candidatus Thermofonsia Clade 1 bacterium TaxID=2364210 RepID=A0A2M8PFK4_9CHLR|nr:MAG: hypothetical protein CUN49_06015 [Candidatus Thermofonsia Clade 1 bacterium]RMF53554.1 MAG: hypothetical protein D6749_01990 [Chloroflexota bacterium]